MRLHVKGVGTGAVKSGGDQPLTNFAVCGQCHGFEGYPVLSPLAAMAPSGSEWGSCLNWVKVKNPAYDGAVSVGLQRRPGSVMSGLFLPVLR